MESKIETLTNILDRLQNGSFTEKDYEYLYKTYDIKLDVINKSNKSYYYYDIEKYDFKSNITDVVEKLLPKLPNDNDSDKIKKIFENYFLKKFKINLDINVTKVLLDIDNTKNAIKLKDENKKKTENQKSANYFKKVFKQS